MSILTQGRYIKVKSPKEIITDIKNEIIELNKLYY